MNTHAILLILEILAVLVATAFGVLWAQDPGGPYEPITFLCLLLGTTGVEIIRRQLPTKGPMSDLSQRENGKNYSREPVGGAVQGTRSSHPLWDVYDLLRTASLNIKYHSAIVRRLQATNSFMEVTLALVAPSSAIVGLWFWETTAGAYAWKFFAVLTAVIAILKPLLRFADRLRRAEESVTAYRSLYHDLETIGILAREKEVYDEELKARFHEALQKKQQLLTQEPVVAIDKKLRAACQREVIEELPARSFYIPRRTHHAKRKEAG